MHKQTAKPFRNLRKFMTSCIVITAMFFLFLTFQEFRGFNLHDTISSTRLSTFIKVDIFLLCILSLIMAGKLLDGYHAQKQNIPGSIIKFRLSLLFGFFAAMPAIAIATFAGIYLNLTLQSWFSERISTAVEEASLVADAYLEEHQQTILNDAIYLSQELSLFLQQTMQRGSSFDSNTLNMILLYNLREYMSRKALDKKITETVIVDEVGSVIVRSTRTLIFGQIDIPQEAFEQSAQGNAVLVLNDDDTRRVRALIKLPPLFDSLLQNQSYMLVGRPVDSKVLQHVAKTSEASNEYKNLENKRAELQTVLTTLYVVVALLFVLGALWIGTMIAKRITKPIVALITAAGDVAKGNLSARVPVQDTHDEMSILSNTFNAMTERIAAQQQNLQTTNAELNERRQFIEAVMIGVSAGVISIDTQGKILFINPQAEKLLELDDNAIGAILAEIVPEFSNLLSVGNLEQHQSQEILIRRSNQTRTLQTQIVVEHIHEKNLGFVITFDDITNLQTAERKAAWSGVARRIAHEIKNPLTPIQLSAERLRRKYLSHIDSDDQEVFELCVNTIIRQVDQIGRLVSEFSSFARLPDPILKTESINEVVQHAFELESQRSTNIHYMINLPETQILASVDSGLLTQVIVNLLKNASEAALDKNPEKGEVSISLCDQDTHFSLIIEDSGKGFPVQDRARILEPYVTSKKEGTGLGLAIVQKVTTDHKGSINLGDSEKLGGAKLSLIFPKN